MPDRDFNRLPVLANNAAQGNGHEFANEREILYKLFFDMKKDVNELKKMFVEILKNPALATQQSAFMNEFKEIKPQDMIGASVPAPVMNAQQPVLLQHQHHDDIHHHEEVEESLNIMDKEKELIIKALKKHKGKRKDASSDLGISERTLYRKLKEYDIKE